MILGVLVNIVAVFVLGAVIGNRFAHKIEPDASIEEHGEVYKSVYAALILLSVVAWVACYSFIL